MTLRRRLPILTLIMAYLVAASLIARPLLAGADPEPVAALRPPSPTIIIGPPLPTATPLLATPATTAAPTATATQAPSPSPTATPSATPTITPTPAPVHVLRTYPIDHDSDIRPDSPLCMVFDQAMDRSQGAVSVTISPTVPLELEWPAPDCLLLHSSPWQPGTDYHLTLHSARSELGGDLAGPLDLSFRQGDQGAPIPILMYHHVEPLPENPSPLRRDLTVSPMMFAAQMDLLGSMGAHVVPLEDVVDYLAQGAPLPARPVVLTFDDGYRSVYDHAIPALEARGLTATIFVIAGSTNYSAFIGPAELKDLAQAGFTIGSHSYEHINVQRLSAGQAERQLGAARQSLEEITGAPVLFFAYPGGWYSDQAIQQLAAYGYRAAVGVVPLAYQKPSQLYKLTRIHVGYDESLAQLRAKLPWG